jgi:hypothetical protein
MIELASVVGVDVVIVAIPASVALAALALAGAWIRRRMRSK